MKLLADLHISPRTVQHLRSLGHDVLRVNEVLPADAADARIIHYARDEVRTILTQDLDFSAMLALAGGAFPSLITLRLGSSRVEHINGVLTQVLADIEQDVLQGAMIVVTDTRIRRRALPIR